MGLLADDVRVDRRSGLRALFALVLLLAVGFGAAWMTLGRTAQIQSLKGVFLTFELPVSFSQIGENGSGQTPTSLTDPLQLRRIYASSARPEHACHALTRSFKEGDVEVLSLPVEDPTVTCSFSGPVGRYRLRADVRTPSAYLEHVRKENLEIPSFPPKTRAIASMVVDG